MVAAAKATPSASLPRALPPRETGLHPSDEARKLSFCLEAKGVKIMSAHFKIGAMVESFRAGLRGGLEAAAAVGAQGVQMYVTRGETHFSKLRGQALQDLKNMLRDNNLELSALCGDFGGHGFQVAEGNPQRIEDS